MVTTSLTRMLLRGPQRWVQRLRLLQGAEGADRCDLILA